MSIPRPTPGVYKPVSMSRSHTVLPLQPLAYPLAQPERKHRRYCRDNGTAEHIRLPVTARSTVP
jgi:hypothetical protein